MAVVQGGEGHQGELAIGRQEEVAGIAQQRQQGLEDELVERLGGSLEGGVAVGQRVTQERGGGVDGLGGAQVLEAQGGVREEHQSQVARLAGALRLGRAGPGRERAVHVGDELEEGTVPGQGRGDTVDNLRGRWPGDQRAQGGGAPGQVRFEGSGLRGELVETPLVGFQ